MTSGGALLGLAGLAGLVLGSYAVTAGLRLSCGEAATHGRSRCDACGITLRYGQTIPVVSFVGSRGVCAACREPIDPLHPAGELAGAAVCLGAAWAAPDVRGLAVAGLGLVLIALSAVDAKVQRLPDALTLMAAALAGLLAVLDGRGRVIEGVVAALATVGVLLTLRAIGRRTRGDPGLGLGDVKLVGGLALWLGAATPLAIGLAAFLALMVTRWWRDAEGRTPFGPMLAVSGWSVGLALERGWSPWVF